jgi:hypothetical protein
VSVLELAPGEERVIKALRDAGAEGLAHEELLIKANLQRGIFDPKYRPRLLKLHLIDYDPLTRKYRLCDLGKEIADTSDVILLLSRSKNVRHLEISHTVANRAPAFLPVKIGVYLNQELKAVEALFQEGEERAQKKHMAEMGHSFPSSNALESILVGFSDKTISKLEKLFQERLFSMADAWSDYSIQRYLKSINKDERRKYLSHFSMLKEEKNEKPKWIKFDEQQIDEYEKYYMAREFPKGGPALNRETLLDFEAAITISISSELLKKSWAKIKDRLAFHVINEALEYSTDDEVFYAMCKIGIITNEDYAEYHRAKGNKKNVVLRKLRKKYLELAGNEPLKDTKIEVFP